MKDLFLFSCVKTADALSGARRRVETFCNREDGVTAIEYAVIAVAVTTALVAIFGEKGSFTDALTVKFSKLTEALK